MTAHGYQGSGWLRALRWAGAVGAAAVLAACGGGGDGGEDASGNGLLRVSLTDAPACGFDNVFVTVKEVRVHRSASAAETEGGWTTIPVNKRVDLLSLTNGVLEELGTTPLAPGQYSQIRLVLASNTPGTGTTSLANAVVPTNGAPTPLDTPSGQTSGIKLQADFNVVSGQTADIVLDFDACKSIVRAGNSGKHNLKPVISVVPRMLAGIQGYVTTTLALGTTTVAAQQNGVTVRSTVPDKNSGRFSIPFLPAGTYTLVITSDGRATGVVTGVPTGTTTRVINGTTTAIVLPVSAMGTVTGSVSATGTGTTSVALTDADVRALQTLTGGPTIEVASKPVDGVLGTYSFRLPVAAPLKASFSAGTMTFVADAGAAGKYLIEATASGRTQTKTVTVTAGTPTVANFTFTP